MFGSWSSINPKGGKPKFGRQTTGDHLINRRPKEKVKELAHQDVAFESSQVEDDAPMYVDEVGRDHSPVASDINITWELEARAKAAAVFLDIETNWVQCEPKFSKDTDHTIQACNSFAGKDKIETFYSDNAAEIAKAVRQVRWKLAPTSTPGDPQSNGVAENCVGRVKAGTKALLAQSGLHRTFWEDAAPAFCNESNLEWGV